MIKNQKGITLIALVITIIVLLILAGVSIAMLTGPNGLLTRAEDSKIATVEGRVRDAVSVAVSNARITKYQTSNNVTDATGTITVDDIKAEVEDTMGTGYTVTGTSTTTFTVTGGDLGGKTMTVTISTTGAITSIATN